MNTIEELLKELSKNLLTAVRDQDIRLVKLILAQGISPNVDICEEETTPLHEAVSIGNQIIVGMLLAKGADFDAVDRVHETPLHLAVTAGHYEIVDALLAVGANVAGYYDEESVLHRAAFNGHCLIGKRLIAAGAVVNARDRYERLPLHVAVSSGSREFVAMLLDRGSLLNVPDEKGYSPLALAVLERRLAVVEVLLAKGAKIVGILAPESTALHLAAYTGYQELVTMLLDRGFDVNCKDRDGRTPLHDAVRAGERLIIELLLEAGACTNICDIFGTTALYEAAWRDDTDTINLFLTKSAGIYSQNAIGNILSRNPLGNPKAITERLLSCGLYSYKHTSANQILTACFEDPDVDEAVNYKFHTALLVAGVPISNFKRLPDELCVRYRAVETTIIQWLAPLKLSENTNLLKAITLAESAYQDCVPSVLRALPRLLRWVDQIQKIEATRKEREKQGHRETLQEMLLVSTVGDEKLEENVRETKESVLTYLKMGTLPVELLVLLRENLIHKTLVVTLSRVYHELPREVVNYLVAEVMSAPGACHLFYKQIFRHLWPSPCDPPMTPQMQRTIGMHTEGSKATFLM